jgi:diacylglycerol kinase (ATP)
MPRIVVVLNPRAGRGRGGQSRADVERLLTEAVPQAAEPTTWRIVETEASGHARELARQAAESGADIVAAAGGDGTLNEVVNGLMGTGVTLGVLPLGTGNDFARCLGIGTDLNRGVETLIHGVARPLDVGKVIVGKIIVGKVAVGKVDGEQANGRWFLNIAGCGFDAIVAERVNRGFPVLRGTAAYLASIALSLLHLRPATLTLTLDGETQTVRALMCSVANATSYGGGMLVAPDARIDDGLFDLCLLREAGRLEFVRAFPRVFKGTHTTHPKVTMLRARSVHIESDIPLPLLIDGEVIGTTPVTFTLAPHALNVLAPR